MLTVNGRKVVQYYSRFTVFQIIGDGFYFLPDLEPVLPGEDEVTSAMRLLKRVLESYPRCFDVLSCDAIYLRPSMIRILRDANKHFVALLKENQPALRKAHTVIHFATRITADLLADDGWHLARPA